MRAFGVVVSEQDADRIERTNDAISRLGLVWRGLSNQLAVAAAPALKAVSDAMAGMASRTISDPKERHPHGVHHQVRGLLSVLHGNLVGARIAERYPDLMGPDECCGPRRNARVIAWRKAFDHHIAEVHGRNGEYLAAACRRLLSHIGDGLSNASLPEPTHSAMHAFLKRVYPQKYDATGQRNVEQFLRNLQPHPLLTHHGRSGSWFYGVAAFMLGREFASDPTSPFFKLMGDRNISMDQLTARAIRILRSRSQPRPLFRQDT